MSAQALAMRTYPHFEPAHHAPTVHGRYRAERMIVRGGQFNKQAHRVHCTEVPSPASFTRIVIDYMTKIAFATDMCAWEARGWPRTAIVKELAAVAATEAKETSYRGSRTAYEAARSAKTAGLSGEHIAQAAALAIINGHLSRTVPGERLVDCSLAYVSLATRADESQRLLVYAMHELGYRNPQIQKTLSDAKRVPVDRRQIRTLVAEVRETLSEHVS